MSGKLSAALKGKQERGTKNVATAAAVAEVTAEKTKRLNVDLPESQYRALRTKASTEDTTIAELVRSWVNEYLGK